MKTQHFTLSLFGAMALAQAAYADEINFGKQQPSASQVIEAFSPNAAPSDADANVNDADEEGDIVRQGQSRSIGPLMRDDDTPKKHKAKKTQVSKKAPRPSMPAVPSTETALSMEILFGYNSAELTDTAKDQLKPVGEALVSDTLQNMSFVIEGHTDAIGGDAANKTLSEQRADAVKKFLVGTYHVPVSRIQSIGKGKNNLLDPKNPDSEVNRRVRIVAVK